MKRWRFWTVALLSLLSISAAAQTSKADLPKLGMLLPLSGTYASGGIDNRRGIDLALALHGSPPPFELLYADSRADPTTGISEFRKLIDTNGVIGMFVMRGNVGMAVNPISRSAKLPMLGAVGNKDFAATNEFAFQIWPKSDEEGSALAKIFVVKGYRRAALVSVQDDWQSSVSAGFTSAYNQGGGKIVYTQDLLPSELDFRTILSQIKALAPAVIFANLSVAQFGPFLRQARELGVSPNIYGNFWVAQQEVLESAGAPSLEGVKFLQPSTDLPALKKNLMEKFSATPSGAVLAGYSAMLLFLQAFEVNPKISTSEELYSALLEQTEIRSPDGAIPVKDRCVKFPLIVRVIRSGVPQTE